MEDEEERTPHGAAQDKQEKGVLGARGGPDKISVRAKLFADESPSAG